MSGIRPRRGPGITVKSTSTPKTQDLGNGIIYTPAQTLTQTMSNGTTRTTPQAESYNVNGTIFKATNNPVVNYGNGGQYTYTVPQGQTAYVSSDGGSFISANPGQAPSVAATAKDPIPQLLGQPNQAFNTIYQGSQNGSLRIVNHNGNYFLADQNGNPVNTGEDVSVSPIKGQPGVYQVGFYNPASEGNVAGVIGTDPMTGTLSPISYENATKQFQYTPGSGGGFLGGMLSGLGSLLSNPIVSLGLGAITGGLSGALTEGAAGLLTEAGLSSELASTLAPGLVGGAMNSAMAIATGGDVGKAFLSGVAGGSLSSGQVGNTVNSLLGNNAGSIVSQIANETGFTPDQVNSMLYRGLASGVSAGISGKDPLQAISSTLGSSVIGQYTNQIVNSIDPGQLSQAANIAGRAATVASNAALNNGNVQTALQNSIGTIVNPKALISSATTPTPPAAPAPTDTSPGGYAAPSPQAQGALPSTSDAAPAPETTGLGSLPSSVNQPDSSSIPVIETGGLPVTSPSSADSNAAQAASMGSLANIPGNIGGDLPDGGGLTTGQAAGPSGSQGVSDIVPPENLLGTTTNMQTGEQSYNITSPTGDIQSVSTGLTIPNTPDVSSPLTTALKIPQAANALASAAPSTSGNIQQAAGTSDSYQNTLNELNNAGLGSNIGRSLLNPNLITGQAPQQQANILGALPNYKPLETLGYNPDFIKQVRKHLFAHGGEVAGETYHPEAKPGEPIFRTGGPSNYVRGKGDGQSDDIPAMLADGEYVLDAELVSQLGDGSNKAGAEKLDRFREAIRRHKRSAPDNKIPPKAKKLTSYLREAERG